MKKSGQRVLMMMEKRQKTIDFFPGSISVCFDCGFIWFPLSHGVGAHPTVVPYNPFVMMFSHVFQLFAF